MAPQSPSSPVLKIPIKTVVVSVGSVLAAIVAATTIHARLVMPGILEQCRVLVEAQDRRTRDDLTEKMRLIVEPLRTELQGIRRELEGIREEGKR